MTAEAQSLVRVEGGQLYLDDKPYFFAGTNLWYGAQLASQPAGRARLVAELDQLADLGVRNLRLMATSEGPDDAPWRVTPALQPAPGLFQEEILQGLDFVLAEMSKRRMRAVVCLGNFWPWTGGMAQYVSWTEGSAIPYPPPAEGGSWVRYQLYASKFYGSREAIKRSHATIERILRRTNSINEVPYREDPTIVAWQLANEPRGILRPRKYRRWIKETAGLIKSLDTRHLVSIGSEGNTPSSWSGNRFVKDHDFDDIDYMTVHLWIQNWGWFDPANAETTYPMALEKAKTYLNEHLDLATTLGKPMVLEEFGVARDGGSHDPKATTRWRDRFYGDIFAWVEAAAAADSGLMGCNFWAWAGSGRPVHELWQPGDPMIGDPPHEEQGWYSIYNRDASTLDVIRAHATKMRALVHVDR